MKRRVFLITLGALPPACALIAPAQAQPLPVVGVLNGASSATYSLNADAFREGLREVGFVENQNIAIDYRWADNDYTRLPALAIELARRNVAVIAATGDIASARGAGLLVRADEVIQ